MSRVHHTFLKYVYLLSQIIFHLNDACKSQNNSQTKIPKFSSTSEFGFVLMRPNAFASF